MGPGEAPAQTIVRTYDAVVAWTKENVAPRLSLLEPPKRPTELEGYVPEYRNPSVFEMFVPSDKRMPDDGRLSPSITVQLLPTVENEDGSRSMRVRYALTVWDPGKVAVEGGEVARNNDGWRSLFNALDETVSALKGAETIAGCYLDRSKNIETALADQDGEILDFWPYWLGRCDFTLASGTPRPDRFSQYL